MAACGVFPKLSAELAGSFALVHFIKGRGKMSKLLKRIALQIALIWSRQVIWTIGLIVGVFLLLCLLALPDVLFMSNRALLENLSNHYQREFTVLTAHSLSEAEREKDVWRLKVYELAPVDEPEKHFWAFNIITGESGGIFGFSNGLLDTYDVEIMAAAFEKRAMQAGLVYELTYKNYPCQAVTGYYSGLNVNIELAGLADLPALCELIAAAAKDTLEQLPVDYDYTISVDFVFIYREPEWPEDKFYPLRVTPFNYRSEEAMSAADMQEEIISELYWYMENYDVWKKLNK